jgi:hypothetical protein
MPHRILWSAVEVAGLVCLGQATILAQKRAVPGPRFDAFAELARIEAPARKAGIRIAQTQDSVVVRAPLNGREAPRVEVEGGLIRLAWADGSTTDVPLPSAAENSAPAVRLAGDDLVIILKRKK